MIHYTVDKTKFQFRYLPEYADFLLNNMLEEFVLVGIRFSRQADLPILKPWAQFTESELAAISMDSNRTMLERLAKNEIGDYVEENLKKWVDNTIGLIDQHDVSGEDLILGFSLRRKIFAYFLDAYTKNLVEQKFIIGEVDAYSSEEELLSLNIFLQLQKRKNQKEDARVDLMTQLLLETQESVEMGSYLINFKDRSQSIYTPQYLKILELREGHVFDEFVDRVHPEDRVAVKHAMDEVLAKGGEIETEYRYQGAASEKKIWAKATVVKENGLVISIKGVIRDVTKKFNLLEQLRENDILHKQAQELTLLGNWSWNLSSGKLKWSEEMYRIFGLRKNSVVTLAQFLSFVHPDYRDKVKSSLETITPGNRNIEYMFRIINAQGTEKVLHGINRVEAKGKTIIRIYGTCQDITGSQLLKEVLIS
jgi:PAS domain S-box-containing protein